MVLFVSDYRSNLVGTRFTVFNNGVNPKKGGVMSDGSNIREEVAAIVYVSSTVCDACKIEVLHLISFVYHGIQLTCHSSLCNVCCI